MEEDDRGMIRHFATGVAVGLTLLLALAPLPFGSVTRWGLALVQVIVFFALAMAAPTARRQDFQAVAAPAGAVALIALLGALQALPWPRFLVGLVSPLHAGLRGPSAAGETGGVPLSLAPQASLLTALTWAAVAAALIAGAVAGRRRHRRRWMALAILGAALFEVLYGAGRWYDRATTIWDTPVPGDPTRLRGTFVNPDHLAVYLEMALPIAFAWGWWGVRRARYEATPERRLFFLAPPVVIWLTLFVGLAFTGSRGGLVAAVVAVTLQGLLLARRSRRRRLAPVGLMAALVGVGLVAAIGLQAGFGRLASTSAYEVTWSARRQVYAATWELWRRFPLLGTGLGTFRDALSLTQPADLRGRWWHAHNDWLETLATVGVVGMAAVLAALPLLVARLSRGWSAHRRSEDRAAALAVLGALASLAIHESVDFGLTMPASAVTLAVMVGAGAVACGSRGEELPAELLEEEPEPPPPPPKKPRKRRRKRH
jgi:O-antigen ligase